MCFCLFYSIYIELKFILNADHGSNGASFLLQKKKRKHIIFNLIKKNKVII